MQMIPKIRTLVRLCFISPRIKTMWNLPVLTSSNFPRMKFDEAENFIRLAVPSVFAEIDSKRAKAMKPLESLVYDSAAAINQYWHLGEIQYNQPDVIQNALTVVIQCCTKVHLFSLNPYQVKYFVQGMNDFNQLTLRPILAVLVKLQVQLELESKEKRAIDYALWDLVAKYHSCSGLQARTAIQIISHAIYFVPGSFIENKQKRDYLAYALIPENDSERPIELLHYKVRLSCDDERTLRRIVIPTMTQNATQTEISAPHFEIGKFDLKWVLQDF